MVDDNARREPIPVHRGRSSPETTPPSWCLPAKCVGSNHIGTGALGAGASSAGARTARARAAVTTVSRTTPSAPHFRHHGSGSATPALDHRALRLESLADSLKTEFVETAERGQIGRGEGSVEHVEVFQMDELRNFHPGRLRHLSGDRRAAPTYTLNCEEPPNSTPSATKLHTGSSRIGGLSTASRSCYGFRSRGVDFGRAPSVAGASMTLASADRPPPDGRARHRARAWRGTACAPQYTAEGRQASACRPSRPSLGQRSSSAPFFDSGAIRGRDGWRTM